MNPLRKAAALALLLPAAGLIALTGAASATAENVSGDLDTEGPTSSPTASPTDKSYAEPDMTDVTPADPFVCPDGHVHVFYNDVDACASVGPDGEPDPAGIVLDSSGGILQPAGAAPAPVPEETTAPTGAAMPAPTAPSAAPVTQGPAEAAETPSAAAAPAGPAVTAGPAAAEKASSDSGPAALVIVGATVALLLAAAGAFGWERRREGADT